MCVCVCVCVCVCMVVCGSLKDQPTPRGNSNKYLLGKFHAHRYVFQGVLGHIKSKFLVHFYIFCNFQMAVYLDLVLKFFFLKILELELRAEFEV